MALFPQSTLVGIAPLLQFPFNEFLRGDLAEVAKVKAAHTMRYIRLLALFQRYRFPLSAKLLNNPLETSNYHFDKIPNFQYLDQLIEKYYFELFKHQGDDKKIFENDKVYIKSLVLRLWLAGYGLIHGMGHEPVTNEVLKKVFGIWSHGSKNKYCRFLSYALHKEPNAAIKEIIQLKETLTVQERELENWKEVLEKYPIELARNFKYYIFGILSQRTDGGFIHEYKDVSGKTVREAHKRISISTWKQRSKYLRYLCEYLYDEGCTTVEDVFEGKLMGVLAIIGDASSKDTFESYSGAVRGWIDYYIKENRIRANALKIVPAQNLGRVTTRYGKHIDFFQAAKLVEVLLDDVSPHHQDNQLMKFRGRRACLLQLETGKRVHEVAVLKRNCLIPNKHNDVFIELHKTKTGKPSRVSLSSEGQKWVEQLQALSPENKIKIDSATYYYGDNLTTHRLLAGDTNMDPFHPLYINHYLKDLQQKIWGEEPPSGRFFSSHDLRRMCATYMKMKGYTDEDIADRLGQDDLKSQYTYTLTIPPETLEKLSQLAKRGLYRINNSDEVQENATDNKRILDTESILEGTSMIIDTVENEEIAKMFLGRLSEELQNIELPSSSYIEDGEMPSGFPMRTHNCKAQAKVTCFHHQLKCYKCNKYDPDKDKLLEHKAELVRWIVFLHHNQILLKKSKDKVEKRVLPVKIDDIEKDLKEAFNNLFLKFKFDTTEAKRTEEEIRNAAKKYIRTYYKKYPSPTVEQATKFMRDGGING